VYVCFWYLKTYLYYYTNCAQVTIVGYHMKCPLKCVYSVCNIRLNVLSDVTASMVEITFSQNVTKYIFYIYIFRSSVEVIMQKLMV